MVLTNDPKQLDPNLCIVKTDFDKNSLQQHDASCFDYIVQINFKFRFFFSFHDTEEFYLENKCL